MSSRSDSMWKEMDLSGWGGAKRARVQAARPESEADVATAFASAGQDTIITHGAGRSYGDQALNDGGRVILSERLDRLISFTEAGDGSFAELVCEPGVTFSTLLHTFLPRGYLFPVSPGTAYTTVGGAVANDVHGKNHDNAGSFGNHVLWLDLMLPDGSVLRASRTEDPALFAATIGGMGLTGFILRVCFRMVRVPSAYVQAREQRIRDLGAFMDAFSAWRDRATFSVGWLDSLAQGDGLGRGILQTAEFADATAGLDVQDGKGPNVPFQLPGIALNPLSIRLFNAAYLRRVPLDGRTRLRPVAPFFYPLDSIGHWNRMYGKRGFYQFQCVVPDEQAHEGIPQLVEEIVRSKAASFLNVLKTLGGEGEGYLSFPLRGYTLAMDIPNAPGAQELLQRLESITLCHDGRVYLSKDATLSPESFREMYPRHEEFKTVLERVDPERRLSSDMARRLQIR
ncbi:MAG: FAD-binding oxidoreductase [Dehalococcoidia bacterium]